jgi:UDP-N-acetylmuramoyl-tripeptide--D-alanyl-D-alanine ligase
VATPIPTNDAPLTADSAAAAAHGRVVRRGPSLEARGITTDSRAVTAGGAFLALRGERFDGHDYLAAATAAGASLLIVERGRAPSAGDASVVEVDDTLVAWGDLARAHLRAWRAAAPPDAPRRVVAVTGSAGKTTTKELCAALLGAVAPVHATRGNLNNRIGVPAVVLGLEPGHRFAVVEAGMSLRGEIAALASILEPDVAVLTNVGVAHAGGVGGTRADVAREKGDLFAALSAEAVAVACFDDEEALGQLKRTKARRRWTFGMGEGADVRLVERTPEGVAGARVRIQRRDGSAIGAWLPMVGEAAAVDLAGALAAADAAAGFLGEERVAAGLRSLAALPAGRMQVKQLADGTTILDDTYNANPQSMRAALRTLGEIATGRRAVVVLGEMRELGESAPEEHASLGASIVAAGAQIAVSCGGLADLAVSAAERSGVGASYATDAVGAARFAVTLSRPGDVILVKASRSVGAEGVVEALEARRRVDAGVGSR